MLRRKALIAPLFALACSGGAPEPTTAPPAQPAALPEGHPPAAPKAPVHGMPGGDAAPEVDMAGGHQGEAIEVLEGGGYTYVHVRDGDQAWWIAGPLTPVAVGDRIQAPKGYAMANFASPSLDRTFPSIDLVRVIRVTKPSAPAADAPIPKVPDGHTIAELYASRAELAGKPVAVRGRVVKFNPNILDTNFLHLQDGSGSAAEGTHDLTVTSELAAHVGDVVVVRGTLVVDRDYGAGYRFPVLVDDAALSEK